MKPGATAFARTSKRAPSRAALAAQRLRESDERGRGRRVVRLARVAALADDGADQHERARAAVVEARHDRTDRVVDAVEVRVDDGAPRLEPHLREEAVLRD